MALFIDGSGDVVEPSVSVKRSVAVDWQVTRVPCVGVVDSKDHEHGQEHPNTRVDDVECRKHQRIALERNDVPVKRRERVETQSVVEPYDIVVNRIFGSDPREPVKGRKRGEHVVGQEEINEHAREEDHKDPHSAGCEKLVERTPCCGPLGPGVQCLVHYESKTCYQQMKRATRSWMGSRAIVTKLVGHTA